LKLSIIILNFFIIAFLSSCNLFETRSPEEPDEGKQNFPPATNPSILTQNFANSFRLKSLDNYYECFNISQLLEYRFIPSPEAFSAYLSLFDNWDMTSERRYFASLISYVASSSTITLDLQDEKTNYISPDSTLYSAVYRLSLPILTNEIPKEYAGRLQLTLIPINDGTWRILRWVDSPLERQDSVLPTWSILKARFY